MSRPRVVCVVGPTASGKTALALELAEHLGAEIVSADSRQIYRQLDIGTAKPTAVEQAQVRHHCLDLVAPSETFDVARYRVAATAAIAEITQRGRFPLIVGGTGLWLRALLRGLCPAPPGVPALRATLEDQAAREGLQALHAQLAVLDPATASRLHPHDHVRVIRALEVSLSTGRPLSVWQAEHGFNEAPFDALLIGLIVPPEVLALRIAERVDHMLQHGWLEEVRGLLASGLAADAPAWRTVGYRELRDVIQGSTTLAAGREAIVRATRRFAARQRTWFRREPGVLWRDPIAGGADIREEITAFVATPRPAPLPPRGRVA